MGGGRGEGAGTSRAGFVVQENLEKPIASQLVLRGTAEDQVDRLLELQHMLNDGRIAENARVSVELDALMHAMDSVSPSFGEHSYISKA